MRWPSALAVSLAPAIAVAAEVAAKPAPVASITLADLLQGGGSGVVLVLGLQALALLRRASAAVEGLPDQLKTLTAELAKLNKGITRG